MSIIKSLMKNALQVGILVATTVLGNPVQTSDYSQHPFDYYGMDHGIAKCDRPDILLTEIDKQLLGPKLSLSEDQTYRGTPQGQLSCMFNAGGWMNSNGDHLAVGIPDAYWNQVQGCGQCFYAENAKDPSKHVVVVGADYCAGCSHFDFNPMALQAMGFEGNVSPSQINVYTAPCPWPGNIQVARAPGSHSQYMKLIVMGSKYPIEKITLVTTLKGKTFEFEGVVEGAAWKFNFNQEYGSIGYDVTKSGPVGSSFNIVLEAKGVGSIQTPEPVDLGSSYVPETSRVISSYKTNVILSSGPKEEQNDFPQAELDLQKNNPKVDIGVQFP